MSWKIFSLLSVTLIGLSARFQPEVPALYATLNVDRIHWETTEMIEDGNVQIEGATVVSAKHGGGFSIEVKNFADKSSIDLLSIIIRGYIPDKTTESPYFSNWAVLKPLSYDAYRQCPGINCPIIIHGYLRVMPKTSNSESDLRVVPLENFDFILRKEL